jgi:integrase
MSAQSPTRVGWDADQPRNDVSPKQDITDASPCARSAQAPPPRSKTELAFWKRRIFKPTYRRSDGNQVAAANFAVEISFRGRRIKWSLATPNREAAAARAKELFLFLQANGWEATLARYRPKEAAPPKAADITVAEFLSEVEALQRLSSRTFADYARALRRIVSGIAGIPSSKRKFDQFSGGHDKWTQAIGAVKLAKITPEAVERWKRGFLAKAKPDPISQRSARVSVNSYLHRTKCLFGKEILKHLTIRLPDPPPLAEVEFEKRPSLKYHSSFDVRHLVAQARAELADSADKIELFKIVVLAAMCGLRRREIDLLPWTAFRWDEGVLRIEPTEFFRPKSEESIADIPLDPEVLALFRGYQARARSEFVVESEVAPNTHTSYFHYRCFGLFKQLSEWLREHGVKMTRALHGLRKEYGSVINRAHGIHAASRALRHSSIGITAEIYVDSRVRTTSGLGYLLADNQADNVLPIRDEARSLP